MAFNIHIFLVRVFCCCQTLVWLQCSIRRLEVFIHFPKLSWKLLDRGKLIMDEPLIVLLWGQVGWKFIHPSQCFPCRNWTNSPFQYHLCFTLKREVYSFMIKENNRKQSGLIQIMESKLAEFWGLTERKEGNMEINYNKTGSPIPNEMCACN